MMELGLHPVSWFTTPHSILLGKDQIHLVFVTFCGMTSKPCSSLISLITVLRRARAFNQHTSVFQKTRERGHTNTGGEVMSPWDLWVSFSPTVCRFGQRVGIRWLNATGCVCYPEQAQSLCAPALCCLEGVGFRWSETSPALNLFPWMDAAPRSQLVPFTPLPQALPHSRHVTVGMIDPPSPTQHTTSLEAGFREWPSPSGCCPVREVSGALKQR